MKTRDKISMQYGLGKTTVARYLRVNKLIPELKERLDNANIGMRVAEALSFLRDKEQTIVEGFLVNEKKVSISIKQADILKEESEKTELNKSAVKKILELGDYPVKIKPMKLSEQFLSRYFNEKQSTEEIENLLAEALEQYFSKS